MTRLSFLLRREWLSLIFGVVLVMLLLSALLGNLGPRDLMALQSHRAALEERRDQLAADNESLRTRVQKLRSDDRYVERLIRRELGYARPDELVYKFADSTNGDRADDTPPH
jgi:cell division protein FtsB